MVESAEDETVSRIVRAELALRLDVRGIEYLMHSDTADCAPTPVPAQHPELEPLLPRSHSHVAPLPQHVFGKREWRIRIDGPRTCRSRLITKCHEKESL